MTKCKTCLERDATPRYSECNSCRVARKNKLGKINLIKDKIKCTGCYKYFKQDENFKTCMICRERGSINRGVCEIKGCVEDSFKNNYCEEHYKEFLYFKKNNISEKIHIDEILNHDYLGGLWDGDGTFNIYCNKSSGKISGYTLKIELPQSYKPLLEIIKLKYGGNIYTYENRSLGKDNTRIQHCYRICGEEGYKLASDLYQGCRIKKRQAELCLKYIPLVSKKYTGDQKQELMIEMQRLNIKKVYENENFPDVNENYIAGIFDAEGCISLSKKNGEYIRADPYVQISQKNHPTILHMIKNYFNYGNVRKNTKWVLENQKGISDFITRYENKVIVKKKQCELIKRFLKSRIDFPGSNVPEDELNLRIRLADNLYTVMHRDDFKEIDWISFDKKKKKIGLKLNKKKFNEIENTGYINKTTKSPNLNMTFDEEHRLKIALSKSGKNTGLTREKFKNIRLDLESGKFTKISLSIKYSCDRNLITKIENGLLHEDEILELNTKELEDYKHGYLKKIMDKKTKNKKEMISLEVSQEMKNMMNSINKRAIKDTNIILKILIYKFKINPSTEYLYTSDYITDYFKKQLNNDKITKNTIKNIWCYNCKLYEAEFDENSIITYDRYLELLKVIRPKGKNPILDEIVEVDLIDSI